MKSKRREEGFDVQYLQVCGEVWIAKMYKVKINVNDWKDKDGKICMSSFM